MTSKTQSSLRKAVQKPVSPEKKKSVWNSLEVVKVIVSMLVPLTIGGLGIWINSQVKSVEERRMRETVVSDTEVAMSEFQELLTSVFVSTRQPAKGEEELVFARAQVALDEGHRKYNQAIAKLDFRIARDVFGNQKAAVQQYWLPARRALDEADDCVARALTGLYSKRLIDMPIPVCRINGKDARDESSVLVPAIISNSINCTRYMLTAARIASLDPSMSPERLEDEMKATAMLQRSSEVVSSCI